MHSKQKGIRGELAIAKYLADQSIAVFTELGDLSKVDLIALVDNKPVKIQVKARNSKNGKVQVDTRKSGPNYRFRYTEDQIDIFAVYVLDKDLIFFIHSKELLKTKTFKTFRLNSPKNNQRKGVTSISDYIDFRKILRDYTGDTLTSKVEGNDIVQTTTVEILASES